MPPILQRLMMNKHTTGAALVYALLTLAGNISLRWFPEHSVQINGTLDDIKQFAIIYGFAMAGDAGKKQTADNNTTSIEPTQAKQSEIMKPLTIIIGIMALAVTLIGCKSSLEPGGAYSPSITNALGTVTNASEMPLYIADTAYKLAFDTVDGVLLLEAKNSPTIAAVAPGVKPALDKIRPAVWDIEQRWALARQAYLANPTPGNLSNVTGILQEMQNLIPVANAAIAPAISR